MSDLIPRIGRIRMLPTRIKNSFQDWRRIDSEIASFESELARRAGAHPEQKSSPWFVEASRLLSKANNALYDRPPNMEKAWKCFHGARRLAIFGLDREALEAKAEVTAAESSKLSNWRKTAIAKLLAIFQEDENSAENGRTSSRVRALGTELDNKRLQLDDPELEGESGPEESLLKSQTGTVIKDPMGPPPAEPASLVQYQENLFQASLLIDEHYSNQAYKKARLRRYVVLLASLQFVVIVSIIGYFYFFGGLISKFHLDRIPHNEISMILGVMLFGLLGSTVSAILKITKVSTISKIPDLVSTSSIMLLRVFMGAASALVIFIFLQSEFGTEIFRQGLRNSSYSIFALSFAAGFTERLVRKAVETVAVKKQDDDKSEASV